METKHVELIHLIGLTGATLFTLCAETRIEGLSIVDFASKNALLDLRNVVVPRSIGMQTSSVRCGCELVFH